jgi:4-amino-4-deoxy-L-arabinose transferase-like glycosyltransferase
MEETQEAPAPRWRGWWRSLFWLLLVVAIGWGIGGYPLLDPDEGRNGEVAREMAAGGDFVLPHLDGLPYLDKPVLFFAADALSQRLLGVDETAARLPSLLFALATAALAGWFAGRLFGRRARAIAAVAAVAAPLPIAFARTVIFDSMLAFFVTLAICAFYLAIEARVVQAAGATAGKAAAGASAGESPAAPGYLGWTALAWVAIGLGVLTKGPVALAVPLLAAAPYALFRRASRAVWHPLGPALLALCVGPWIWAVSRRVPEFLHYALVTETWQRVTTPKMNREAPIWFFIPVLVAGALPWSVLVLAGWRRSLRLRGADRRVDPRLLYLALWIALPVVLFSLSHSKRPQYILPLLPAVAILAGKVWGDAEEGAGAAAATTPETQDQQATPAASPPVPGARAVAVLWLVFAVLCAAAAPVLWRSHSPRLAHLTRLPPTLCGLAAAFLVGAALVAAALGRWRLAGGGGPSGATSQTGGLLRLSAASLLLAGLVLPMAAMPALTLPLLDEIGRHRSSRAAAEAILPRLTAGAEVVGVRAFPPSLPFYLRRTVLVASPRGRELTSNYVIAYFQKWIAADPRLTPLRPFPWWRSALAACDHPLIFVAWADDADARAALAATGLPLIVVNDRMAAYGPCRPAAFHR